VLIDAGGRSQNVGVPANIHNGKRIPAMPKIPFKSDVQALRKHAREHLDEGAVTAGYSADRNTVLKHLNDSLATGLVCVLRYRRHHFMARGIHSQSVAQEFLVHSNEEQGHADEIAARIVQLGGAPDFAPDGLAGRSHAQYVEGDSLASMIREDLVAERIAIDSYRDIIKYLGDKDPTTRRMLEGILAVEEQHADELSDLLVAFPVEQRPTRPFASVKSTTSAR
jgi:bacterioferritin